MKPIEEIYRTRVQSCVVEVTAERGAVGADQIKKLTGLRANQIRRIVIAEAKPARDRRSKSAWRGSSSEDISRGVAACAAGREIRNVELVPRRNRGARKDRLKSSVDGVVKHPCQAPLKHWGVLAVVVGGAIHKETAYERNSSPRTSNLGPRRPT